MRWRYDLNETGTRIRLKFNVEQLPLIEPGNDVRPTEMRPIDSSGTRKVPLPKSAFDP